MKIEFKKSPTAKFASNDLYSLYFLPNDNHYNFETLLFLITGFNSAEFQTPTEVFPQQKNLVSSTKLTK